MRQHRSLVVVVTAGWAVVAVVAAAAMLFGRGGSDRRPSPAVPPELSWNLTHRPTADSLRWPAQVGGPLWRSDEPAFVSVLLPRGRSARYLVDSFQVRQDGGRVTSVSLGMPCETARAAHDRALSLARQWGVLAGIPMSGGTSPAEKLQAWYAAHGPGGTGKGPSSCELIGPRGQEFGCTVAIRPCYDGKDSYFVTLAFGGFAKAI
jgi:hypothetical protein